MTDKQTFSRRNFMSSLVGGAASLAATSSLTQAASIVTQDTPQPNIKPRSKGYQRTEHVNTYYQLADL